MKHLKKPITAEEQQERHEWRELPDANEELFNAMPETDDMEIVFT